MKLRGFCFILGVLASLPAPATPQSTPSRWQISVLGDLDRQLITWFDSLSGSFDKLADSEDRRRLKSSLIDLNKAIYDLESNGRFLVETLSRGPLIAEQARLAMADTTKALANVREKLQAVGLLLRTQYREGGADAEQLIAAAMSKRAAWLSDVEAAVANNSIPHELINEGWNALRGQRNASLALTAVIEKM